MEIQGTIIVERPRDELTTILFDPDTLKRCIPGCHEAVKESEGIFRIKLKIGAGILRGRFRGHVRVVTHVAGESYTLSIRAQGTTGRVSGTSLVVLRPRGEENTELGYDGEFEIGGAIATMGARLFRGSARGIQDEFFRNLAAL